MNRLRLAVLMGGDSPEHEVSLASARAVIAHLNPRKYQVLPFTLTRAHPFPSFSSIELVFPVLHGPHGEDGSIQGLLELLHLPYVGCGVAASALCLDKTLQKDLCHHHSLPQLPYFWFTHTQWQTNRQRILAQISSHFKDHLPLFVKPANQGSSLGITKVEKKPALLAAIRTALTYSQKVVVELGLDHPREIECALLGHNHAPQTSVLGEIIPHGRFYDYASKYHDPATRTVIPAQLTRQQTREIRVLARRAYTILGCEGLARVDFLLDRKTNNYYLNEVNTMPGFTSKSIYPQLWQASGLSFPKLLDRLIELAQERYQSTSPPPPR